LLVSVIARSAECAGCEVTIDYLGQLGSNADTVLLSSESMIVARKDGGFILAPTARDGEAAAFDSLNAVARSYGRLGGGPGENGRIMNVLPWRGDTILFAGFDRLTFLTGDDGHGRTARLERPSPSHRTVALPGVSTIVRNYTYPPDHQFIVFSEDGTILSQLGNAWRASTGGDVYDALAELGPAGDSAQFWSAPQRYRMHADLWSAVDGTHLRRFRDSVPWFAPYDSAQLYQFILDGNDSENPPPPFLRGIRETSGGVLWLLYSVPAKDWARSEDTLPPLQRRLRREAYDAVLELRNPVSGASLLSVWSSVPFARLVNDSLLADRRQTEEGFWVYDVYKVALHRHGAGL
jgi:hypothetical protein